MAYWNVLNNDLQQMERCGKAYISNLQINMLTTYLNVNFNEMLETFQRTYAQYLY